MEYAKVIMAVPLSIVKNIEGIYYSLNTYEKLDKKPKNVILGSIEQDPKLLNYISNVVGYVTKYGGITSHLAIVGRELGIPVYRYDGLDSLVDGEYIIITPYKKVDLEIKDKINLSIRNIYDGEIASILDTILLRTSKLIKQFSNFLDIYNIKIVYSREKDSNIVYINLNVGGIKKLVEESINNPNSILEKIEKEHDTGISIICKVLAEHLGFYLYNALGDIALYAIHRHIPYWLRPNPGYLKIRFGINDKSFVEYLHSLLQYSNKKEVVLDEPFESIAKLVAKCIEKYEEKNENLGI